VVKEPYCRFKKNNEHDVFFVLEVPVLNNFDVGDREFGSEILGAKNPSLETNLFQTLIQQRCFTASVNKGKK
jgi:hypothetical protein